VSSWGDDAGADLDQGLEQVLARRDSIYLSETSLAQAIAELSARFQVPLVVASRKLEEAGVNLDTPITKQLTGLPLESILRLMLGELDLTFTIREHMIVITTPEDAEQELLTRVYPVLDLVTP